MRQCASDASGPIWVAGSRGFTSRAAASIARGNYEAAQGGVEMVVASNIGSSSSARTGGLSVYGAGVEYQTGRGRRKT